MQILSEPRVDARTQLSALYLKGLKIIIVYHENKMYQHSIVSEYLCLIIFSFILYYSELNSIPNRFRNIPSFLLLKRYWVFIFMDRQF